MKTRYFCELLERAMRQAYDQESDFDNVSYLPEEGGEMATCLGIFIHPEQHMAVVAANAMHLIYQEVPAEDADEAMGDFCSLMAGMKIAPYMQWHCAYFPDLTADQVLAESEAGDEPRLDMSGTDVVEATQLQSTEATDLETAKELKGMLETDEIDVHCYNRAIVYLDGHPGVAKSYRDNGMKFADIADSIITHSMQQPS
jgi:hypothetical protein